MALNLKRLLAEPIDTHTSLTMTRFIPTELQRRGVELRLVIEGDNRPASRPDLGPLAGVEGTPVIIGDRSDGWAWLVL